MKSTRSLLLASAAFVAVATLPHARTAAMERPLVLAQAATPGGEAPARDRNKQHQQKPAEHPAKPQMHKPAQPTPPVAGQPKPPAHPLAQAPQSKETPPHQQPATKPPARPQPPAAQQPAPKPPAPAAQQQQQHQPQQQLKPHAPAAQQQPAPKPPAPAVQQQPPKPQAPTAQQPAPKPPAPAAQQQPPKPQAPTAQQPAPKPPAPAAQQRQHQPQTPAPAAQQQPPHIGRAVVTPPPQQAPQPRDASEFIRRDGQKPGRKLEDVRRERQETREGNRVIIREGNRTIVREDNRVIIRHSEVDRFAIGALNVRVDRRGGTTETVIQRPNGVRIVNIVDADGRLLRRVRRDRNGREIVLINNVYRGPRVNLFVHLPPPVIRIPRERYIVEVGHVPPAMIYDVFVAPPVERLERRYTLDEVRYSAPLRERMPRVDLDINFETGSWQIGPAQMAKLAVVADGLNRAIARNPSEVFLIEGYTDAVGSTDDNLSLSDRRAEAVAVALAEQFNVPTENLVTQGYGEQNLKVQTQGDEPRNRRVSVRRITPLIEQQAAR